MNLEGQRLGEFEILERLGQGGMGAVYKARQVSLGRFVALKTLQAGLADDVEYIVRFQQEARAAAVLNHPNLVQVYSSGESEGLHWFAMEYVEGESAKGRLNRKGRLDPLEAIAIAIHVATALEYGWRKASLIHRDIKPDNIFLSSDGEVKLGDLGLAKSAGQTQGLTMTGASMGTPHYISPEQVMAMKTVDLRADIYSLGCTLYHLLSGQAPFAGNSAVAIMMKHVNGPVPDLRVAWPDCPQVLADVVGRMMQKEPAQRQQNYAEVITDLRHAYDVVSGVIEPSFAPVAVNALSAPSGSTLAVAKRSTPRKTKLPAYTALVAGALLIAAIVLFILNHNGEKHIEAQRNAEENVAAYSHSDQHKWHDLLAEQRSLGELAHWATDQNEYVIPKHAGFVIYSAPHFFARNAAISTTWANDFGQVLQLRVLRDANGKPTSRYECRIENEGVRLLLVGFAGEGNREKSLKTWPLPSNFNVSNKHTVVFQAIDDLLQIQIDGIEVGALRDQTIKEAGEIGIAPPEEGWIYKVEYVDLDSSDGATTAEFCYRPIAIELRRIKFSRAKDAKLAKDKSGILSVSSAELCLPAPEFGWRPSL